MTTFRGLRFRGAALLVACVLLLAACGDADTGGDRGGGGSKTPVSSMSNAELLKAAVGNMKALKSYHLDNRSVSGSIENKTSVDSDVANNRGKMVSGNSVLVRIGTDMFQSADGGRTFTKGRQEVWADDTLFTTLWTMYKVEDIDASKEAFKDGSPREEKIGSDATRHITGDAKAFGSLLMLAGLGSEGGTIDMWITTGDKPYVRKVKYDSKATGEKAKVVEMEWTRIDEPISIEAPAATAP